MGLQFDFSSPLWYSGVTIGAGIALVVAAGVLGPAGYKIAKGKFGDRAATTEELYNRIKNLESQRDQNQKLAQQYAGQLEILENKTSAERDESAKRLKELEAQLSALPAEASLTSANTEEKDAEIARLSREREDLQAQVESLRASLSDSSPSAAAELKALHESIQKYEQAAAVAQAEADQLRSELDLVQAAKLEDEKVIAQLRLDLEEAKLGDASAQPAVETPDLTIELNAELEQLKAENNLLHDQISELNTTLVQLQASQDEDAKEQVALLERELAALHKAEAVFVDHRDRLHAEVLQLQNQNQMLESELEAAKAVGPMISSGVPMTDRQELVALQKALVEKHQLEERLNTLQSENDSLYRAVMIANNVSEENDTMRAQIAELMPLKEQLEAAAAEKQSLLDQQKSLETKLADIHEEFRNAADRLEISEQKAAELDAALQNAQSDRDRLTAQLEEVSSRHDLLRRELTMLQAEHSAKTGELESIKSKHEQQTQLTDSLASQIDRLETERTALREQTSNAIRAAADKAKLEQQLWELQAAQMDSPASGPAPSGPDPSLTKKLNEAIQERDQLKQELDALKSQAPEVQAEPKPESDRLRELEASLKIAQNEASASRSLLQDLSQEVTRLRQSLSDPLPSSPRGMELAGMGGEALESIDGIGEVYQAQLYSAGIRTFSELANATPQRLDEIIRPQEWQRTDYASWIKEAARLAGRG